MSQIAQAAILSVSVKFETEIAIGDMPISIHLLNTPLNLAQLLKQAVESFPARTALVGHTGLRDEVWSYHRLSNTADNIAWQLLEIYRFRPGDRILIHGFNSPQLVACYFGCFTAGLIVVPLDRHSPIDFIVRIAQLTEASALLSNDENLQLAELPKISAERLVRAKGEPGSVKHVPQADDIAEIVFTSGTTGTPKGVMLTHRNIVACVRAIEDVYPKRNDIRFLSLLPLSHMFEQTAGLLTPLSLGATIYFLPHFQTVTVMRKLEAKHIHGVIGVPQMLEMLLHGLEKQVLNNGGETRWRLWWRIAEQVPFRWRRYWAARLFPAMIGTPEFFVCGGAPLPSFVERRWELLGVRVIQGYGSTECAPVISVNHFDNRIPGSVGWPVDCVRVSLSEPGEILVQGDNVSPGYWQNADATANAFTEQHGYRTGDLGEFGASGELYIKGRSKDMIVLANGMNVYPEDIEQILAKQPGVMACMVTDLPDMRGTDAITAVLCFPDTLNDEQRQAIAHQAVSKANALLAPHQRIGAIRCWQGDFPRTALMKVQRYKVKSQLLAEQRNDKPLEAPRPAPQNVCSIEQLLASICRVPVENISADTDLVLDLGCDSLARVELAGLIEEQLGIICDDAELIGIHLVSELKALVEHGERTGIKIRFPAWPLSDIAGKTRELLHRALGLPLHRLLSTSFEVTGLENLERLELPAMFIANHTSHVDTLSILRALPNPIRKRLCIAAAADYFFRNRIVANVLALLINAFPFRREGSIRSSLEHCGELLDQGWSILIYPEGTRSTTGRLMPFKPGIGLLATGLGAAVVPVAVDGGYKILPKGAGWPSRSPVKVSFGEALTFEADTDKQQATAQLHDRLSLLLTHQANQTGVRP